MAEQPKKQKRFVPQVDSRPPWVPPEVDPEDIGALRAVYNGTAEPHLQRRAMEFILKGICGVNRTAFWPGERDGTILALGKQMVGHVILDLVTVKVKPGGENG